MVKKSLMKFIQKVQRKKGILSSEKVKSKVIKSRTEKYILRKIGNKESNVGNQLNIDDFYIEELKEQCENFHKIEHFFEDVSLDDFSGSSGEYNEWSLPEILLLLHRMDNYAVSKMWKPTLNIEWESFDFPREGAKKTWEAIIDILPQTMEQAIARVKTFVVSSIWTSKNSCQIKLCRKKLMENKRKWIMHAVAIKTSNVINEDLFDGKRVYEAMSPLGKLIVSVAGWDALTAICSKKFEIFVDWTVS